MPQSLYSSFLRGRYSRSSLMCYKTIGVQKSQWLHAGMLNMSHLFQKRCIFSAFCFSYNLYYDKQCAGYIMFLEELVIVGNHRQVQPQLSIHQHVLAVLRHTSNHLRCLLSWSDIASSIEVRYAAVVNLLALGQACRVFELFTSQCVRLRTDHLCQRLAFCVSSARFVQEYSMTWALPSLCKPLFLWLEITMLIPSLSLFS